MYIQVRGGRNYIADNRFRFDFVCASTLLAKDVGVLHALHPAHGHMLIVQEPWFLQYADPERPKLLCFCDNFQNRRSNTEHMCVLDVRGSNTSAAPGLRISSDVWVVIQTCLPRKF